MNYKVPFVLILIILSSVGSVAAGEGTVYFGSGLDSYNIWFFGNHHTHVKDQEWYIYAILQDGNEKLLMHKYNCGDNYYFPKWNYVGEYKATKKLRIEYYFKTQNAFKNNWNTRSTSAEIDNPNGNRYAQTYVHFDDFDGTYDGVDCSI
jgi:hypothetical protein